MIQLENILKKPERPEVRRVTIDLPQAQYAKLSRLCEQHDVKMVDVFRSLIDAIDEPVFHNTQGVEL